MSSVVLQPTGAHPVHPLAAAMAPAVMGQADRLRAALAARYEVGHEIGRGGMACVYLARDQRHERDVALKVLRPELAASLGSERFLREIRIEARLQHPHILPLHDSGVADGLLYYVMPFVEGETLRDRIRRERQLPLPDAIRIACEVADALSYAHAHGVVHRDIKPANILLSGGHAVVADFGVARAIVAAGEDAVTEAGLAIGTPEYMSPEQGSADVAVDGRTDLYALGCVLFEMLAGEPPFTGRSAQSVIARHRQDPPPSLSVVRPALPLSVQAVVETALAKIPADRFATGADFARALGDAVTMPRPVAIPVRKPLFRLGPVVAAGIVLAGIAGVWWSGAGRAVALDGNKVMVLPLVEHGDAFPDDVGEQVAIMIGSALEHTEPIKWIDGWTWMDEEQRANPRGLTGRSAAALSRDQHARYFIDGSIVRTGDSATVIVRLHDAGADSVVTQASAAGPASPALLPQIGLQALTDLLPALLDPGRPIEPGVLRVLSDRRPGAIASWLQGEREYRRSHFVRALDYYQRAVGSDSALAFAALKGAQAANWADRDQDAEALLAVALAHRQLLPDRYDALAEGLRAYLAGEADSAAAGFLRALNGDRQWSEAWMWLGEVYYHLFPRPKADDLSAERYFQEARRLDPDFGPPLFHLAEIALRQGEVSRAERLLAEFRRSTPDRTLVSQLSAGVACLRDGGGRRYWTGLATHNAVEVVQSARALAVTMAQPRCAAGAFKAVYEAPTAPVNVRAAAAFGLHGLLVAAGQTENAAAVLKGGAAVGLPEMDGLAVAAADGGAPAGDRAAELTAGWLRDPGGLVPLHLWYLAIWSARRADTAALVAVARELGRRAEASRGGPFAAIAASVDARLALARGDSLGALRQLEALAPRASEVQINWGIWQPLGSELTLRAELLLARGAAREALDVARQIDHPQPVAFLLHLRRSLAIRLAASQRLGWRDSVTAYRGRLEALDRLPDLFNP